jgi:alpha-tubulin suppressor-like RCC1 family protein
LRLGDQWAAQSVNTIVIPPTVGVLALGSTATGNSPPDGDFDEFRSFARPLDQADLAFYYNADSQQAALGPITQAEIAAREQATAAALATRSLSTLASPMRPEEPFEPLDALCDCMTGGQVYLTNLFATITTNQSVAVTFNLAGGTNFVWYGVYSTTGLANEQWVWLTNTYTCTLVSLTNQPWPYAFYAVRSPAPTMVVAWGDSWYGACDVPPELTNATDVAGGYDFSLALNADGTVAAWGDNTYGQTNVPAGLTNVTSIAAGGNFALALLQNGTVVAWGGNDAGQRNLPAGLTNVAAIAAGGAHAIVLRKDGTVVAWGFNLYGQTTVPNLGRVKQVAAGFDHSVALLTNGTVVVWGLQGSGFGWNITNVPIGLSNVVSIAAGGYHTLALKADGTVTAWGAGTTTEGYLNLGQSIVPGGLSNVVAVAGGVAYSMALQSDGTVVEWGDDAYDELELPDRLTGVRTISAGGFHGLAIRYGQLTPLIANEPDSQTVSPGGNATFLVQADGFAALTYQWQLNGVNIPGATNAMLTLSNVQSEVAGAYQVIISSSSGSVTSGVATLTVPRPAYGPGLVSGWGANANGELSWQTDTTNVISLAAGKAHGIVAQDNGLVVSWGSYWTGYNYVAATTPPLLTNAIAVAAGSRHDLALKADGTVLAWGLNDFGQTNVPTNTTNIIAISAGGQQSLALKRDGTVVQWGQTNGPVPAGLTNVTAIASGTNFHLALLRNSTVIAWGATNYSQTSVPAGLSNAVAIAAGGAHALALKIDGTVSAWGALTNVPTGLSNVMNVAAGENHSVALKNDGTVIPWGDNTFGQTNFVSGLNKVKLLAGGGDFTLAVQFSTLVMYPVDVTKDLLLIYNTTSADSIWVKDYYLAHRPMVGGANALGVGCTNIPSIKPEDYTNTIAIPVQDWLVANPTKRPQYVILMAGIPWRINTNATPLYSYTLDNLSPPFVFATRPSVQYQLATCCAAGWQPFVTSINMGEGTRDTNGIGYAIYTNACKAYIDKLADIGRSYSAGRLVISANAGTYSNTNLNFDNVRYGFDWDWCPSGCYPYSGDIMSNAVVALQAIGHSDIAVTYRDGVENSNAPAQPAHITNAVNVAGYMTWGEHSLLGGLYATFPGVRWQGNSGWYLIETIESFNGQPGAGQGDFFQWFSAGAFGGTNYLNTPVGAVTHVDEPGLSSINDPQIYFGLWMSGKTFGICSWNSRRTDRFQAVGDPFVTR